MKRISLLRRACVGTAALAGALVFSFASPASAQNVAFYGLTSNNALFSFTPGNLLSPITPTAITGLGGQDLIGIDFRNPDGLLYGVGTGGTIFTIDTVTAAATSVGTITGATLNGTNFGFDFNPTNNLLRITSDAGQSIAVNVTTGVTTAQPAINGATTSATSAGYTNNFLGAATTSLFVINSDTDELFTQVAATSTTTLRGSLGIDIGPASDIDIVTLAGVNSAYLTATEANAGASTFYTLDLGTGPGTGGAATAVGTFNLVGGGFVTDVATQVSAPEPGSIALIGTGLLSTAGMMVRRRRVR